MPYEFQTLRGDVAGGVTAAAISITPAATFASLDVLRRIPDNHIVASLDDARDVARELFADSAPPTAV